MLTEMMKEKGIQETRQPRRCGAVFCSLKEKGEQGRNREIRGRESQSPFLNPLRKDSERKKSCCVAAALFSKSFDIPASVRICDEIGASGRIPVKHLANSNGSRYKKRKI
jgi:hypothetical protein